MFTQPTVDLKPIHNRMPVILEPAAEDICGFKPAICPTLSGYPGEGSMRRKRREPIPQEGLDVPFEPPPEECLYRCAGCGEELLVNEAI